MSQERELCPGCGEYLDECSCASFEPVLPFDTDEPLFALGVEVGMVWAHLGADDDPLSVMVHSANAEMMLRMAEAQGRAVHSEEHGDTWATVHFGPVEREDDRG